LLLEKWQALIDVQTGLVTYLTEYEKDMFWGHEVPVNTVKSLNAIAAIAGAALLFVNPPVGIIVGLSSGGAGLATMAGDSIATKIKKSKLGYRLAALKTAVREF